MNNPQLYNKSNSLQKYTIQLCLEKFKDVIEWKKDALIFDVGCGDGSAIANLMKDINCKSVIGCDISENMVRYANEHYSSERLKFILMDIQQTIPDHLRGYFHQAISFYVLQLCRQENSFQNIYDLLKKGGSCFAILVGRTSLYDAYRTLVKTNKWRTLLADAEKYISPYHDSKDALSELHQLLSKVGFNIRKLDETTVFYDFGSWERLRDGIKAILPFKIPDELCEDFYMELCEEIHTFDTEKYGFKKSTKDYFFVLNVLSLYVEK